MAAWLHYNSTSSPRNSIEGGIVWLAEAVHLSYLTKLLLQSVLSLDFPSSIHWNIFQKAMGFNYLIDCPQDGWDPLKVTRFLNWKSFIKFLYCVMLSGAQGKKAI